MGDLLEYLYEHEITMRIKRCNYINLKGIEVTLKSPDKRLKKLNIETQHLKNEYVTESLLTAAKEFVEELKEKT